MDIHKENNLIKEAFEVEADEIGFCLDQEWGDYENPYENSDTALAFNLFKKGWQAAKAQAVQEGFVLVSQKESNREAFELVVANKLQNSLYHSVFFNEATGWYYCVDDAPAGVQVFCCDLNSDFRIWKAAKAQAIPDGFVLVPKEPTEEMLIKGNRLALADKNVS